MSCIDIAKIEAWLKGVEPAPLDREALSHLRGCRNCIQNLRIALALRASAAIPNGESFRRPSSLCVAHIEDETRLAYLDDTLEEGERSAFENHLPECAACRQVLLEWEYEIVDLERSEAEVPASLLTSAHRIGEAEIARHESAGWVASWLKGLSGFTSGGLRPRWVAALAVLVIVGVTSVFYFRSPKGIDSNQRARLGVSPSPSGGQLAQTQVPGQVTTKASGVDPATVDRIQKILDQVERAADSLHPRQVRLNVIDSNEYIAQVSPEGELTLSTRYIAATRNDDEMAFLLAHEVSHRQHPTSCILSFSTSRDQSAKMLNSSAQKQGELQADRMGVFLASVAGFQANAAETLLGRIQNIPNISDKSHPEFNARLEETAGELHSIVRSVELFRAGISFFNTEQYSRSVAVFEAVAGLFPSREAFNDLGLAYHKLAMEYSPQNWGFKKSVILDPVARAIEPVREDLPEANLFTEFLNKAIEHYQQAISRDPSYVAVRINLASALDEKGDYAGARRELADALKMKPVAQEKAKALNNLAVIAAKQSQWDEASALLARAVEADSAFPDPHFNLARVWELQGKAKDAYGEYGRYAKLADNQRDGWLRMAYNKLDKPWTGMTAEPSEILPKLGRVQLGATLTGISRLLGAPAVTWQLKTPTHFDVFVSLFEASGLLISGSEDVIDFVQTTSRYSGIDPANHLSLGMTRNELATRLRNAARVPVSGTREGYINFGRGLGINFRNEKVDAWYIFEPVD
ncbi:MAG: tetratricopeptide repeat protein [Acidobacteriia bacterium]|nr:tetratricopeptide repeat protein [Terriglobia bacterium]